MLLVFLLLLILTLKLTMLFEGFLTKAKLDGGGLTASILFDSWASSSRYPSLLQAGSHF